MPVRVDHVRGDEIVAGRSESSQEPSECAAERESCHADGGIASKDRRETAGTGRRVQLTRMDAGLDACGAASGINHDRFIRDTSMTIPSSQTEAPSTAEPTIPPDPTETDRERSHRDEEANICIHGTTAIVHSYV